MTSPTSVTHLACSGVSLLCCFQSLLQTTKAKLSCCPLGLVLLSSATAKFVPSFLLYLLYAVLGMTASPRAVPLACWLLHVEMDLGDWKACSTCFTSPLPPPCPWKARKEKSGMLSVF